jgi:3'(2'), 5'-bisphosphate nucleotidase
MWWSQPTSNSSLLERLQASEVNFASLLNGLLALADESAELARQFYRNPNTLEVKKKSDATPVTEADQAIHRLLLKRLPELLPGVPVLSEECNTEQLAQRLSWKDCWVVDPLDGTREFIERTDQFTINIALCLNGSAELGLISVPCEARHWLGVVGDGAVCFDEPVSGQERESQVITTRRHSSDDALVLLASHRHHPDKVSRFMQAINAGLAPVERLNSGSAVKFCLLADGRADIYPRNSACSEWDVAAGDALVRAAGGRVTDLMGEPLVYNRRESLRADNFIAAADPSINFASLLDRRDA